ncbi:MAG: helix-turn-helix domain-containing protein [Syntrophomonadaceae bacterium]|jgi:transcriptional regulator with XRE-family HTH domain
MRLGERLLRLRKAKRITQIDLAKAIGVGKTTISNYETGYSTPDTEIIKKIADFFDVSTDYLLGRTATPQIEQAPQIIIGTGDASFNFDKDIPPEVYKEIINYAEYVISKYQAEKNSKREK